MLFLTFTSLMIKYPFPTAVFKIFEDSDSISHFHHTRIPANKHLFQSTTVSGCSITFLIFEGQSFFFFFFPHSTFYLQTHSGLINSCSTNIYLTCYIPCPVRGSREKSWDGEHHATFTVTAWYMRQMCLHLLELPTGPPEKRDRNPRSISSLGTKYFY